jgi:hypothetical protein
LVAALALYLAAVLGIGLYVDVSPTEGLAATFGQSLTYFAVVGVVTLLATRRSKGWNAPKRQTAGIAFALVIKLVEQPPEMGVPVEYSASRHARFLRIAAWRALASLTSTAIGVMSM